MKLELEKFLVVQWLYRLAVEEVPEHDYMLPLSEAEVRYFGFIMAEEFKR